MDFPRTHQQIFHEKFYRKPVLNEEIPANNTRNRSSIYQSLQAQCLTSLFFQSLETVGKTSKCFSFPADWFITKALLSAFLTVEIST